ncbi:hypothetical protein [Neobacillus niacini]|uniref:hypothetical protein n=1 Tax=Neobacillus niacini TaxID=86668 RepID=UPI0028667083|nr:hypothetical protein [Neobacillus niacini]MDR7002350.1 hypothetical protein [Neobacillus niacini]
MAIYSHSSILTENEIDFLLDLLPTSHSRTPDIYIFDGWQGITTQTEKGSDLSARYYLLKHLVKSSIFSSYNYQQCKIFIYLFNLPYQDPLLKKLHGVFCLFHEMRHHHQFTTNEHKFLQSLTGSPLLGVSYSFSWVEKDANRHAIKWMRRNRKKINDQFQLHFHQWDIGVNEQNKLRILPG